MQAREPDGSARLLYDKQDLSDGTMQADIRFLQTRGNGAGILLRVTDIGIGKYTLIGYEIRLNREASKIQLIKHRNDEQILTDAPVIFSADGWQHIRTTGSHRHYKRPSKPNVVTIPGHPGDDLRPER